VNLISFKKLEKAIRKAWCADTTYSPEKWSMDNPSQGQCAVTALLVQEFLGGIVSSGIVNGVKHFWNVLDNGERIDLTAEQFDSIEEYPSIKAVSRKKLLSYKSFADRYYLLKSRVGENL